MAALSFSWDDLPDDSKWLYEAMARMGFEQFAELPITNQQLVLPSPTSQTLSTPA